MTELIGDNIATLTFVAFFLVMGLLWAVSRFIRRRVDTCEACGAIGPIRCPAGHCLRCPENVCDRGHCIECKNALCAEGHCLKCVGTTGERNECAACHQVAPRRRQFGGG